MLTNCGTSPGTKSSLEPKKTGRLCPQVMLLDPVGAPLSNTCTRQVEDIYVLDLAAGVILIAQFCEAKHGFSPRHQSRENRYHSS